MTNLPKRKDDCPCGKTKPNGKRRKYKNCCGQDTPSHTEQTTSEYATLWSNRRGFNDSEHTLIQIADRSFLKMWSYPNVFYAPQKELCDLLVVFKNTIVIFSDKRIELSELNEVTWDRWYRKAVLHSIKQAVTAKNRILRGLNLYVDSTCSTNLPIDISNQTNLKIHLVCVANGATEACKQFYGDSRGSLTVTSDEDASIIPFAINLITERGDFVHVLDELSLKNVLENLDTITDFTDYLTEKEIFMRKVGVVAGGEEDLLAEYLMNFNESRGKRDFEHLVSLNMDHLYLEEGIWENYIKNEQYLARKSADEISYFWDYIIERFTEHAMNGTQYISNPQGVTGTERALRMMGSERRFARRILSKSLYEIIIKQDNKNTRRRYTKSPEDPSGGYAFLAMRQDSTLTEEAYRERRGNLLYAMCLVYKYKFPELKRITGIATEIAEPSSAQFSEDLIYLDIDELSPQQVEDAKAFSEGIGIMRDDNMTWHAINELEYPENSI